MGRLGLGLSPTQQQRKAGAAVVTLPFSVGTALVQTTYNGGYTSPISFNGVALGTADAGRKFLVCVGDDDSSVFDALDVYTDADAIVNSLTFLGQVGRQAMFFGSVPTGSVGSFRLRSATTPGSNMNTCAATIFPVYNGSIKSFTQQARTFMNTSADFSCPAVTGSGQVTIVAGASEGTNAAFSFYSASAGPAVTLESVKTDPNLNGGGAGTYATGRRTAASSQNILVNNGPVNWGSMMAVTLGA